MLREGVLIVSRTLREQEKNGWEIVRDLGSFSRVRGTEATWWWMEER